VHVLAELRAPASTAAGGETTTKRQQPTRSVATETPARPTSADQAESGGKKTGKRPAEPKRKRARGVLKIAIFGTVALIAIIFGFSFWQHSQRYEETDDSYVAGHSHPLSFRVNGTISHVWIDDNQFVKAGQPLAKLDPRDFAVQLQQAEASRQQAQAQLKQSQAQIIQAEAQLRQAQAQADSSKAKFENSQRLADRNRQLFYQGKGVISQQDLDNTNFQLWQDKGASDSAAAAVKVSEANLEAARAQERASAAQLGSAEANLENAKLQLSYTTLYAPADGRIAKKTLEAGQRVQPNQSVVAVVETYVWVVANFKETQLARIKPGQHVKIAIDAIPEKKFVGIVDSFQRGTGAVFTLLPPDNATGNFTKIVQRVPVKIVFDLNSIRGYEDRIVPGLSIIPSIKVRLPHSQRHS
jgi:membrane fusion protein, multidrug efflux system